VAWRLLGRPVAAILLAVAACSLLILIERRRLQAIDEEVERRWTSARSHDLSRAPR
jgi:hypothetical protein